MVWSAEPSRRASSLRFLVAFAVAFVPGIAHAQEAAPPVLGLPRLHIDAESPVVLHEVSMERGVPHLPVCESPCDRIIEGRGGQRFFFGAKGVPPSARFRLANESGELTARVHPGSNGLRGGGIGLATLGGLSVLTGSGLLLASAVSADTHGSGALAKDLEISGVISTAAGLAVLASGIVRVVMGGTSSSVLRSGAAPGTFRF
jgi:hypothetical protein